MDAYKKKNFFKKGGKQGEKIQGKKKSEKTRAENVGERQ